jgi:hypothetical protein
MNKLYGVSCDYGDVIARYTQGRGPKLTPRTGISSISPAHPITRSHRRVRENQSRKFILSWGNGGNFSSRRKLCFSNQ